MASPISEEFKKVTRNEQPNSKMLVPLLTWFSSYEQNIEMCQKINRNFLKTDKQVLSRSLALRNKLRHFVPYPKVPKDDPKIKFFYNDLAKYYGWTITELKKNLNVIDVEAMKEFISKNYGYDNTERKAIGLKKRKLK